MPMTCVDDEEEEDGYVEYVPARERKRQRLGMLAAGSAKKRGGAARGGGDGGNSASGAKDTQTQRSAPHAAAATTPAVAATPQGNDAPTPGQPPSDAPKMQSNTSLLAQTLAIRAAQAHETEAERLYKEELELLRDVTEKRALMSAKELATDNKGNAQISDGKIAIETGWRPPEKLRRLTEKERREMRDELGIIAEGTEVPPPIDSFAAMKLPRALVRRLDEDGIVKPTPIQMQGLPVILSGRDMIGVAFTGSGKTLSFLLPLLMACASAEMKAPLTRGTGPVGLVLCPSRELARQTYEVLIKFSNALTMPSNAAGAGGETPFRNLVHMLCMGGVDAKPQMDQLRVEPVHGMIATPGRLKDYLNRRRITLSRCTYLCLDEADRMILDNESGGFEEDIRHVLSFFEGRRQTVMFSATMPTKIKDFAKSALIEPIMVNVGRAGAANLNVTQEVDYVKDDAKAPFLLECLQKTAPPVMVFSSNKDDVNHVLEHLLLAGVDACAVHGDMDQEDRSASTDAFKRGEKDVLIATDVAGKGLDFANIQHVINYDMPKELEMYVHRIGRTGRGGKRGMATTFVNRADSESILLDLKHLLVEAKQRIPPFLAAIDDPADHYDELEKLSGTRGCLYCGGLGHRIAQCPKLLWEGEAKARGMMVTLGNERKMYGAEM